MVKKKTSARVDQQPPSADGGISICRNKHWKYISAYHGSWLSLPVEMLECIAMQNWNHPAPRAIEPGVLFDILKIRRLIDLAAEDAVRAANGTLQTGMKTNRDYTSLTGDPGGQLSKQRVLKIRQKACKSLSEAFELDEIAASVASMASTSTLEDVAQYVLRQDTHDIAAKYVHFFLEKIPSRAMKEHTTLDSLDGVISKLSWEAQVAPLRTRAGVQAYKAEYNGAIADYSAALRAVAEIKSIHKPNSQQLELASKIREDCFQYNRLSTNMNKWPTLKEEDRPSGMEMQLLFGRASAYLDIALSSVHQALDGLQEYQEREANNTRFTADAILHQRLVDARKQVKTNAKRALKDLMAFLTKIEYTPGLPQWVREATRGNANGVRSASEVPKASTRYVPQPSMQSAALALTRAGANGHTGETAFDGSKDAPPIMVYTASMLFTEKMPADVPPFPNAQSIPGDRTFDNKDNESMIRKEYVTYHPLLIEVLHLLLIAHTLLQTSTTELRRHAFNAVRLTTLASGYSVFQTARSPARANWAEVLRSTNDWISLGGTWADVMRSARLSDAVPSKDSRRLLSNGTHTPQPERANGIPQAQAGLSQESMIEVLSDDRVVDEKTFHRALAATQERDRQRTAQESNSDTSTLPTQPNQTASDGKAENNRAQLEDRMLDPICSDHVNAIVRWVKEAPLSLGGAKKKRPSQRKKAAMENDVAGMADSIASLAVSNGEDAMD